MKILFFGSTLYSKALLEHLIFNKFNIHTVCTTPEYINISYSKDPVKIYNHANIKKIADQHSIPTIMIDRKITDLYEQIKRISPDLILALGWYFMIPKKISDLASFGCVGIHASLLPKYAGGAPLVWAMINGEKISGVSLFYLDKEVDTGDIIDRERFIIEDDDNIASVYRKATEASKKILLRRLPEIEEGRAPRIPQDLSQRTEYPQRSPEDGKIDWSRSAEEIRNFIRAQSRPYPGAFSYIGTDKVSVLEAKRVTAKDTFKSFPGKVVEIGRDHFIVSTGDGLILISDYEPRSLVSSGVEKIG
jgi:methionyl-tRNA formyltransferase